MAEGSLVKVNHTCETVDKWHLHLVRTTLCDQQGRATRSSRSYPVLLVPGLASSGAYSFDLTPAVSLADWLAARGWDVWVVELRGNGLSDKASLLAGRSRWWTVDDMVEKDLPAAIAYVCMEAGASALHCVGHSMGGMILTAALARGDEHAARMRSVTLVGSSCFLEGSWWAVTAPTMPAARVMYSVPAGGALRLYSRLAFTRLGLRALDVLYFWPRNTDPALARAVLARNFSSTSPGVITQFKSAFGRSGLRSAHRHHTPYANAQTLGAITTPVFLLTGDMDKMCPPQGARKQFALLTSSQGRKLVVLGPASGHSTHYGHFDILMGKSVHKEVFPLLQDWLATHDVITSLLTHTHSGTAAADPAATVAGSSETQPPPPCVPVQAMSGQAEDQADSHGMTAASASKRPPSPSSQPCEQLQAHAGQGTSASSMNSQSADVHPHMRLHATAAQLACGNGRGVVGPQDLPASLTLGLTRPPLSRL